MKKYDNIDWKKLAEEYSETGISLTKMSEKYEIGRWTLTKKFKELGLDIINRQNQTKFDDTVFDSIDSEEKAYWLGFIFADGYIDANKYVFEISLKSSDREHLEKFNMFMKHQDKNHVKISKSKCGDKCFERCRWYVSNKHLWKTLNNYGCTPNKSTTLEFPNFLHFKYDHLIRHFIRGYFDGDGSFSRYILKTCVNPHIQIIGTPEFLNKLLEYTSLNGRIGKDKRWKNNTEYIEFDKDNGIKFINYIYNNSKIYLDKKYKLFEFFKNGSRSLQEWNELLQTKNGEICDDNPVVNSEIKESESPYSVEVETEESE